MANSEWTLTHQKENGKMGKKEFEEKEEGTQTL